MRLCAAAALSRSSRASRKSSGELTAFSSSQPGWSACDRGIVSTSMIFPPRTNGLGVWKVNSEKSGKVPFEITYFTSGIGWRAFYMGTLSKDEKTMRLQGYVRVANNSGEEYADAQTRLIVGKVNLIDEQWLVEMTRSHSGSRNSSAAKGSIGSVMR